MEIIATLPPPHLTRINGVAINPDINMFRFNTGAKTPFTPEETLKKILEYVQKEKLWLDLKGRQLRIAYWSMYPYGDIVLTRDIRVDLPATIHFRNDDVCTIVERQGRKIFVDPAPRHTVGEGQAVNIHGDDFEVIGDYLTDTDKQYIEAANKFGVHKYMLSFLEKPSDVMEVLALDTSAEICGKIESIQGLNFINKPFYLNNGASSIRLLAARDDLFTNIGANKKDMFEALKLIIKRNPDAIVASKILTSLYQHKELSFTDLSDIYLMQEMGYKSFMLGDELSFNTDAFNQAVSILKNF